jgi:hypothetical protein
MRVRHKILATQNSDKVLGFGGSPGSESRPGSRVAQSVLSLEV